MKVYMTSEGELEVWTSYPECFYKYHVEGNEFDFARGEPEAMGRTLLGDL